jgi:hypothetical protein
LVAVFSIWSTYSSTIVMALTVEGDADDEGAFAMDISALSSPGPRRTLTASRPRCCSRAPAASSSPALDGQSWATRSACYATALVFIISLHRGDPYRGRDL